MYSAAKSSIEGILEWLKGEEANQWEQQIASLHDHCSELEQLSHPPIDSPDTPKLREVLPDLWKMLAFMQDRDRRAALQIGNRALRELP